MATQQFFIFNCFKSWGLQQFHDCCSVAHEILELGTMHGLAEIYEIDRNKTWPHGWAPVHRSTGLGNAQSAFTPDNFHELWHTNRAKIL